MRKLKPLNPGELLEVRHAKHGILMASHAHTRALHGATAIVRSLPCPHELNHTVYARDFRRAERRIRGNLLGYSAKCARIHQVRGVQWAYRTFGFLAHYWHSDIAAIEIFSEQMQSTFASDLEERICEFAATSLAVPIRIPDNENHRFLLADVEKKCILHSWNRFLRFAEGEALPE